MTNDEMSRRIESLEKKYDKHDDRLDVLENKQTRTDEQLVTVFNVLKDIADDTKWIRRTFITALIGGVMSAVVTLIVWLIKGGFGG